MASVDPKDKTKPHVANRRIKWKGANPPVYLDPGQKDENGKLITFTLEHIDDAAYLMMRKRNTWHLATAEELKTAVVLKSNGGAEVTNDSNS